MKSSRLPWPQAPDVSTAGAETQQAGDTARLTIECAHTSSGKPSGDLGGEGTRSIISRQLWPSSFFLQKRVKFSAFQNIVRSRSVQQLDVSKHPDSQILSSVSSSVASKQSNHWVRMTDSLWTQRRLPPNFFQERQPQRTQRTQSGEGAKLITGKMQRCFEVRA